MPEDCSEELFLAEAAVVPHWNRLPNEVVGAESVMSSRIDMIDGRRVTSSEAKQRCGHNKASGFTVLLRTSNK